MTNLTAPQVAQLPPAPRTPLNGATQSPERMRQAARDFEAQVLGQLLQPAFATVDASKSAFGGGAAEAQWRPMLVDAFATAAAGRSKVVAAAARIRDAGAGISHDIDDRFIGDGATGDHHGRGRISIGINTLRRGARRSQQASAHQR